MRGDRPLAIPGNDAVLSVYTTDEHAGPIGVIALDDVSWTFRTARLWAVSGDKSFSARGYVTAATSKMLTLDRLWLDLLAQEHREIE